MQGIIPQVVAWLLLILGLSYAVNTAIWLRVARDAMARPAHYFFLVILTLVLGLAVVAGHNVWVADWPVAVTLFGWILVAKSTLFLLFPQSVRLFRDWPDAFMTTGIRAAGLLLALLGGILVYQSMSG
jgi:uncharacterized membrane protein YphA (DoxX/SURF4 family)